MTRQITIREMFDLPIHESLNEDVKDSKIRKLSKVPGLTFATHHVANFKYLSILHQKSGKFLLRSMHVQKIGDVTDLANHLFGAIDFNQPEKELVKRGHLIHNVVNKFKQEVDRIHTFQNDQQEKKEKAKKDAAKLSR